MNNYTVKQWFFAKVLNASLLAKLVSIAVMCCLLAAMTFQAQAGATHTWTGGGGDNNWGTAANWDIGLPVNGDNLVFSGNTRQANINNLLTSVGSVTINSSGFNISGNALTITGTFGDTGDNTWAIPLTLGGTGSRTIESYAGASGGTLTISGTIALGAIPLILNANHSTGNDGNIVVSGIISGSGSLTKGGASSGAVTLSGVNTFTGKKIINSGFLVVSNDSNLGAVPGSTVADQIQLNGGFLRASGSFTINSKRGSTIMAGGLTTGFWANEGITLTYGGVIGASVLNNQYHLTLDGAGTIELSGNNTYRGNTAVIVNVARISHSRAFGNPANNGGVIVNVNSTVELIGGITVGSPLFLDVAELVNVSGNNTWSGPIEVYVHAGGSSVIRSDAAGSKLTLSGDITIDTDTIASPFNDLENLYLEGAGNIDITGAIGGDGTDGAGNYLLGHADLVMNGTGTLTLTGANIYSGRTLLNSGTLVIDSDARLGAVPDSATAGRFVIKGGATVVIPSSFTLDANRGIALGTGTGTVQVNPGVSLAYSGIIANNGGAGSLAKTGTGTLTLGGANTYSGATSVSAGKLTVDGSLASGSAVTVASGAILSGTGNAAGTTTISGTVAPGGAPGALNTGTETWNAGATNIFEMSSATGTPGTNWDLLRITGNLDIPATVGNPFSIKVYTMSGVAAGQAANFNNTMNYEWPIATVTGSITRYDATKFIVDTSEFLNNTGSGKFGIKLSTDQKTVLLTFTVGCIANQTTATYELGSDGNIHMYFSNPLGLERIVPSALLNCTLTGATAYGPGFQGGTNVSGFPLTTVGSSATLPLNATRVEVIAHKINSGSSANVNVMAFDSCGAFGWFDPVDTTLCITQPGVLTQVFTNIPAAEKYVRVLNGETGLKWLNLSVNGRLFVLDPLNSLDDVLVNVGSAMGEGDTNIITLSGFGIAGASARILVGDSPTKGSLNPVAEITGSSATRWQSLVGAGNRPLVECASVGDNLVLTWSEAWTGYDLQSRDSLQPTAIWASVPLTPVCTNGQFSLKVKCDTGKFFRLVKP